MQIVRLCSLLLLLVTGLAQAGGEAPVDGLVRLKSPYDVKTTLDRLQAALEKKGITIVTRWDHAARARAVGMELRPTELLIFGNPRLGSPLMARRQTVGIDLPMKALAWQDANGQVWLGYNDPAYLAERHAIGGQAEILQKMSAALSKLSHLAVAP